MIIVDILDNSPGVIVNVFALSAEDRGGSIPIRTNQRLNTCIVFSKFAAKQETIRSEKRTG